MHRLLLYLAAVSFAAAVACTYANSTSANEAARCDKPVEIICPDQKQQPNVSTTTATTTTSTAAPRASPTQSLTQRALPLLNTPVHAGELITKTAGTIYKALSNVFTYEDDYESVTQANIQRQSSTTHKSTSKARGTGEPPVTSASPTKRLDDVALKSMHLSSTSTVPSTEITTTTAAASSILTTTTAPATTSSPTAKGKRKGAKTTMPPEQVVIKPVANQMNPTNGSSYNNETMSSTLLNFLSTAIKSVYSINFLNRTARLAPEHDLSDFSVESGKLMLAGDQLQQPATSDDVHLLCKLLHKHFENQTKTTTTTSTTSTTTVSTTSSTRPTTTTSSPQTSVSPTTGRQQHSSSSRKPQVKPTINPTSWEPLTVANTRELSNEAHRDHLLESVLQYNASKEANEVVSLEDARELLLSLFNAAFRLRQAKQDPSITTPSSSSSEYESDEELHLLVGGDKDARYKELLLHTWNLTQPNSSPGKLRLVYWLLEPPEPHHTSRHHHHRKGARLRVWEPREAIELLGELEPAQVQRQLSAAGFSLPTVLAEAYRGAGGQVDQREPHEEPHVIDDSLISVPEGNGNKQPSSAFRLLLDKLSHSSFLDNLHLYLVIFMVGLLLVILCFACPLFCCKPRGDNSGVTLGPPDTGSRRRRRDRNLAKGLSTDSSVSTISGAMKGARQGRLSRGSNGQRHSAGGGAQVQDEQDDEEFEREAGKQASDSIWRKLSNTTTTLVRDQSQVTKRSEGLPVASGNDSMADVPDGNKANLGKFDWYSFENRFEEEETRRSKSTVDQQSQTYIISDMRRQVTKSVQTAPLASAARQVSAAGRRSPLKTTAGSGEGPLLDFKERQEKRSSDTLTKSELVMIKEKLVPIAQQLNTMTRQVASQTSVEQADPNYVNLGQPDERRDSEQVAAQPLSPSPNHRQSQLSQQVSRYIDSSGSRSDSIVGPVMTTGTQVEENQEPEAERRPKMRLLELPARTQSKVEAIKAELSKLEQRDATTTTTPRARHGSQQVPGDASSASTYRRYDL